MITDKHRAAIIKHQEEINDNFKELTDRVIVLTMVNSYLIGALILSIFTVGVVLFTPFFKVI